MAEPDFVFHSILSVQPVRRRLENVVFMLTFRQIRYRPYDQLGSYGKIREVAGRYGKIHKDNGTLFESKIPRVQIRYSQIKFLILVFLLKIVREYSTMYLTRYLCFYI